MSSNNSTLPEHVAYPTRQHTALGHAAASPGYSRPSSQADDTTFPRRSQAHKAPKLLIRVQAKSVAPLVVSNGALLNNSLVHSHVICDERQDQTLQLSRIVHTPDIEAFRKGWRHTVAVVGRLGASS